MAKEKHEKQISEESSILSASIRDEIDGWAQKYPPERKQSAVLYALRIVQQENGGWLTEQLMDAVADYLQLPKIAVYEVASFYSLYDLKPVGKHKIYVCTNISCMLRGADKIVHHLEKRLGVPVGETSADGKFTLKEAECLAACGIAPMLQIDTDDYHGNLTVEKVDAILDNLVQEQT